MPVIPSVVFIFLFPVLVSGFFPNSFKASFREERTGVLSKEKIINSGFVEYKYPGRLRFELEGPIATVLVVSPEKTWYYTAPVIEGEKGELRITATKKGSVGKVFDLMRGGIKNNENYRVVREDNRYELILSEATGKELGVQKINLFFKEAKEFRHLSRMDISSGGRLKSYFFRDIDPNANIPEVRFRFQTPANTNVTSL